MITLKRTIKDKDVVTHTVKISIDNDVRMEELFEAFKEFSLALGYDAETVKEFFDAA